MKCHYEILEVPRDATDDIIKKSYRTLALKWHPDKNPDRIQECTQHFALLQQAYEVLSDAHERAFYDRHRESILKGGMDAADHKNESLDVCQFYTASCYKGFGTDEKSFYSVYRNVFDTLANEDYDYIEDPSIRYPSFGDADSDYNTVVGPFYGFWMSFCTARSFAWLDRYDVRDGNNRYEVRAIEAENKKYRDAGKAERNDEIRELAAFIRKRDPRIKAYRDRLEQQQIETKKKQEENRKAQIRKNRELAEEYQESEESKAQHRAHLEAINKQLAEQYGESCSEAEDEEGEGLPHCVVCDKSFKTMNAKVNHEQSKQHKKQLAELKKHMKDEDVLLFESSAQPEEGSEGEQDDPAKPEQKGDEDEVEAKTNACPRCIVCDKTFKSLVAKENHDNSKQHRKQLAEWTKSGKSLEGAGAAVPQAVVQVAEAMTDSGKQSKRDKKRAKKKGHDSHDDEEEETGPIVYTEQAHDVDELADAVKESTLEDAPEENLFIAAAKQAEDKKKKRRADKKGPSGAGSSAPPVEEQEEAGPKTGRCDKCGEFFPSRTQLFQHIKQTGHATLLGPGGNKKGKRK